MVEKLRGASCPGAMLPGIETRDSEDPDMTLTLPHPGVLVAGGGRCVKPLSDFLSSLLNVA